MKYKKYLCFVGIPLKQLKKVASRVSENDNQIKCKIKVSPNECCLVISTKSLKGIHEVDRISESIKRKYKDYCFASEKISLEEVIVKELTSKSLIVTTAESCTGGLLAGRIVNASGASTVFEQGFITYSNRAKRKLLNVKKDTLKQFGAVSSQTAMEMAEGAAIAATANVALAVTGIAGPEGGTKEKPVGLVYIACYYNGQIVVEEHHFKGDRKQVRRLTVSCSLDLLRRTIG